MWAYCKVICKVTRTVLVLQSNISVGVLQSYSYCKVAFVWAYSSYSYCKSTRGQGVLYCNSYSKSKTSVLYWSTKYTQPKVEYEGVRCTVLYSIYSCLALVCKKQCYLRDLKVAYRHHTTSHIF